MNPKREKGQVLVLFAGALVGFVALSALVIDLASVYSTQQTEKAAADAAALAGAQDLQALGSQALGNPTTARTHALQNLAGRFGVAGDPTKVAGCDPSADITDCWLAPTAYHIAISTPSKTTHDPRSLQVSVTIPNFQLTFSRLLGQNGWNVGRTSVAGLGYGSKYAVITLQPPAPKPVSGQDANECKDISVDGTGTVLNIVQGDIGTNTSANTTNSGLIQMASGYQIDHIDDLTFGGCQYTTPGASWSTDLNGNPPGNHIGPSPLIQDPAYYQADFTNATTYKKQSDGLYNKTGTCTGAPGFPTDGPTVSELTPSGSTLTCYSPGIYSSAFSVNQNTDVVYLLPGAYRFDGGMKMGGTLAGGLIDSKPGVVLVFPQTQTLAPNNAIGFLLNSGSANCKKDSCRAKPAMDFAPTPAQVATPEGLTITIEVPRDDNCFSGNNPIISASCAVNQNNTVSLAGNAFFQIAGVLYGPSDNMQINASVQNGFVGQIYSWTIKYAGGATLNQSYPFSPGNGILRLDVACSGGDTPCVP